MSFEQQAAEFVFQSANVPANGRLAYPERDCGLAEILVLGGNHEGAQPIEVDDGRAVPSYTLA